MVFRIPLKKLGGQISSSASLARSFSTGRLLPFFVALILGHRLIYGSFILCLSVLGRKVHEG